MSSESALRRSPGLAGSECRIVLTLSLRGAETLETCDVSGDVKRALLALADPGTPWRAEFRTSHVPSDQRPSPRNGTLTARRSPLPIAGGDTRVRVADGRPQSRCTRNVPVERLTRRPFASSMRASAKATCLVWRMTAPRTASRLAAGRASHRLGLQLESRTGAVPAQEASVDGEDHRRVQHDGVDAGLDDALAVAGHRLSAPRRRSPSPHGRRPRSRSRRTRRRSPPGSACRRRPAPAHVLPGRRPFGSGRTGRSTRHELHRTPDNRLEVRGRIASASLLHSCRCHHRRRPHSGRRYGPETTCEGGRLANATIVGHLASTGWRLSYENPRKGACNQARSPQWYRVAIIAPTTIPARPPMRYQLLVPPA